jgi:hypothetical protein
LLKLKAPPPEGKPILQDTPYTNSIEKGIFFYFRRMATTTPTTTVENSGKVIERLHKLKQFRLHTGNINNYVELKMKRFTNSAEELIESLNLMMNNLSADTQIGFIFCCEVNCSFDYQIYREDGMLLLADEKHCDNAYERDDLKITLKLFIEKFEFQYIRDATGKLLLHISFFIGFGFGSHFIKFHDGFSEAVLAQLQTDSIEQLILAFPEPGYLI